MLVNSLSSDASVAFTRYGEILSSATQRSRSPALVASWRSVTPLASSTESDVAEDRSSSSRGNSTARTAIHQAHARAAHRPTSVMTTRRGQRSRRPRTIAQSRRSAAVMDDGRWASPRTYLALISMTSAAVCALIAGSYISSATVGGRMNLPAAMARIWNSWT